MATKLTERAKVICGVLQVVCRACFLIPRQAPAYMQPSVIMCDHLHESRGAWPRCHPLHACKRLCIRCPLHLQHHSPASCHTTRHISSLFMTLMDVSSFLMQASAEAVAQRAKEALEHAVTSFEPAVNEVRRPHHVMRTGQEVIAPADRSKDLGCEQRLACAGHWRLHTAQHSALLLHSCQMT